ncbi:MAG: hypothetical protein KA408_02035 [Flavobacteriales bacterium]|nr:hypothetical protein [Flavobacteriales bacterium]
MNWRKIAFRTLILGLLTCLILILFAHPYFAMQRPVGSKNLVVEGWMHHEGLMEARALFLTGGYDHMYVTGTMRPFAYYLEEGEEVRINMNGPIEHSILVGAAGLPTTIWYLISGTDTLLTQRSTTSTTDHEIDVTGKQLRQVRFESTSAHYAEPGVPIAFIAMMDVDGTPAHSIAEVQLVGQDGTTVPGWPTHADAGRAALIRSGIPADKITAVPTLHHTGGRTFATGRTFVEYAKQNGIEAFDIATLGVHARRTWKGYVTAKGTSDGVGIISLYDPWCKRWTWWLNPYGWFQIGKEVVALPRVLIQGQGGAADQE